MTVHKIEKVFQVNVYVKYFQRQLGIICKKVLLASSEMGLKEYCWDNKWKKPWLLTKILEIGPNQIDAKLFLFLAAEK